MLPFASNAIRGASRFAITSNCKTRMRSAASSQITESNDVSAASQNSSAVDCRVSRLLLAEQIVAPRGGRAETSRISVSSFLNKHLTCNGLLILNFAGAQDGTLALSF
jgi:hypothetical protein